ncbi:MAG TPA: hypothetical protein PK771_05520 [Spirochaetota bacterium]|nr:hypothetical protein [Spirochaetota bacterium]
MVKKINLFGVLFILILICFNFNCKTMQLNQTAEIIEKNKKESAFSGGVVIMGISPNNLSGLMPSAFINLGFRQRFGISEDVEIQIKGSSEISAGWMFGVLLENHNVFYVSPKFKLFSSDYTNVAILPHFGVSLVVSTTFRGFQLGVIGGSILGLGIEPQIGFSFIASRNSIKNIYWGFIVNMREDFSKFYWSLQLPLVDLDLSFNIGWEDRKKVIYRHEFSFFTNFDLSLYKQEVPVYEDSSLQKIVETKTYYFPNLSFFTFGLCYSFSIGKEY